MRKNPLFGDNQATPRKLADYFGLTVEVILRMESCSLIRWKDRESIVSSEDLYVAVELAA
jgi:hypothetical protein